MSDNEIIPVVAACIVDRDYTKVLLHKKTEAQDEEGIPRNPELLGRLEFVGGMMKKGEKPEEALRREVLEEISREIDIKYILYAQTNIYKDGVHYLVLFYLCRLVRDQGLPVKDCQWFDLKEVGNLNALPGTLEVINRLRYLVENL